MSMGVLDKVWKASYKGTLASYKWNYHHDYINKQVAYNGKI